MVTEEVSQPWIHTVLTFSIYQRTSQCGEVLAANTLVSLSQTTTHTATLSVLASTYNQYLACYTKINQQMSGLNVLDTPARHKNKCLKISVPPTKQKITI